MAAAVMTLDIPEIQVIVEYAADPNAFYWHHRVLLHKLANGIWLALTPDMDVVRHDLNNQNHIVLERNSYFPRAQAPYVYAMDPVSRAVLESKKRTARNQAIVLGDEDMIDIAQTVWLVAQPGHPSFGETIPRDVVEDIQISMVFESKGVTLRDGEEVFIQMMQASEVEEFKKGQQSEEQDSRILGVHTNKSGKRRLELDDGLLLMREDKMDDFPLGGDIRAVKEFLEAVLEGPGNLPRCHVDWQRLSGISDTSSISFAHKHLCEMLRVNDFLCDQVNPCNLASAEYLVRWLIQLETAVERNPRAPSFHGLELIMGGPTTAEGKAVTRKFTEHLTALLKTRASIWKQERLYQEELRHQAGPSSRADKGDGKG